MLWGRSRALRYVFDTICDKASAVTAVKAREGAGGILCTVRPGRADIEGVSSQAKVTGVLIFTAFWKDHRQHKVVK